LAARFEPEGLLLVSGPGDTWEARTDATPEAYRLAFRAQTTASWELVEIAQGDLLRLLVGRVPAVTGAEVILGLATLFRDDPEGDAAGRALLTTIMGDLRPAIAWTLLVALSDGFFNAGAGRFDDRPATIRAELARALRRLLALDLPISDRAALERVRGLTLWQADAPSG